MDSVSVMRADAVAADRQARRTAASPSRGAAKRVKVAAAGASGAGGALANTTNLGDRAAPRRGGAPRAEAASDQMHKLFSLERERTQESASRERLARQAQVDRMRQLEEELMAERQYANEHRPEPRRRGVPEDEVAEMRAEHADEVRVLTHELDESRQATAVLEAELARERAEHTALAATHARVCEELARTQSALTAHTSEHNTLTQDADALRAGNERLRTQLYEGEAVRRRLHNQVQELRGNVRVYARVRPAHTSPGDAGGEEATIRFPDPLEGTQVQVCTSGESATGAHTVRTYPFTFDHVFAPSATQADVFSEVSQLIQSVLDGYNTTIFAYGQTGSGKTHTLEGGAGGADGADAGMIPRAMHMLWDVAEAQRAQGWSYEFEAQMLQIYLDNISDLLARGDGARHEVRHEQNRTTVTNATVVPLHGPEQVHALLARAKQRRAVAATQMNERSSRSHSVFMLRVRGAHAATGETTDATLNLVDLAGSERLAASGSAADPTRLKEAQSINRSLSSLADVIGALGADGAPQRHVPYRNSTLTWLLKNSLGGNAKTYV